MIACGSPARRMWRACRGDTADALGQVVLYSLNVQHTH